MPRVKRQPARRLLQQASGGSSTTSLSVVDIEDEIDRWNGVKTAHTLLNDMQVAKMLLDCYDLIGADALGWTNKEPPQSDEALELLKQKADVGLQTLQEIRTLIAMPPKKAEKEEVKEAKEEENVAPTPTRKSKRKTTKVQHIKEEVDPDFFVSLSLQEAVEESGADVRESGEGASEEIPDEEKVPPGDDDPSSDWEVENSKGKTEADSQPKPQTGRKRGRPKKGEEPPKKEPKKPRLPKEPKEPKEPKRKPKKEKVPKEPTEPKKPRIKHTRLYDCRSCEARVESIEAIKGHYMDNHMDPAELLALHVTAAGAPPDSCIDIDKIADKLFKCFHCNVITKSLKHHSKKHQYPRVCEKCGKVIGSNTTWVRHKREHAGVNFKEKNCTCEVCGKKCSVVGLRKHILTHSDKRPWVCEVCGKAFKIPEQLRVHKLIHDGITLYTCSFCGKGFRKSYNLKGHIRTHTGEKPFRCNYCSESFTHNVSLKTHVKKAHGIDLWKTPESELPLHVTKNSSAAVGSSPTVDATSLSDNATSTVETPSSLGGLVKANIKIDASNNPVSKESESSYNISAKFKDSTYTSPVSNNPMVSNQTAPVISATFKDGPCTSPVGNSSMVTSQTAPVISAMFKDGTYPSPVSNSSMVTSQTAPLTENTSTFASLSENPNTSSHACGIKSNSSTHGMMNMLMNSPANQISVPTSHYVPVDIAERREGFSMSRFLMSNFYESGGSSSGSAGPPSGQFVTVPFGDRQHSPESDPTRKMESHH